MRSGPLRWVLRLGGKQCRRSKVPEYSTVRLYGVGNATDGRWEGAAEHGVVWMRSSWG